VSKIVVLGIVLLIAGFILAIFENIICVVIGVNMLWAGIVFILVGDYWNCQKEKREVKNKYEQK
jgi:hypothetical protein